MSFISVKFVIHLSFLQASFQDPILLFLRRVSLIPESRRGPWERGCLYCRIEHKTVVQSCYKSGKIKSNPPENRFWARDRRRITATWRQKRVLCVCVCVRRKYR